MLVRGSGEILINLIKIPESEFYLAVEEQKLLIRCRERTARHLESLDSLILYGQSKAIKQSEMKVIRPSCKTRPWFLDAVLPENLMVKFEARPF